MFFNLFFLLELCRQSLSEDSVSSWCCSGKCSLCTSMNEGAVMKCTADSQRTAKAAVQYYSARVATAAGTCFWGWGSNHGCCRSVANTADCCCAPCIVACAGASRMGTGCLKPPCHPPLLWMNMPNGWWETWEICNHCHWFKQRGRFSAQVKGIQILARAGEAFFSLGLSQICLYLCCGYNLHLQYLGYFAVNTAQKSL